MLDAYCWPQSAAPGERVDLMVSGTGPTCRVEISRVGADVRVVDVIDDVAVAPQRVPDDVAENGCRWDPTVTLTVGPDWASGFHRVRLMGDDGDTADAFFVVRASEPGDAIVVLATSTYAAYNDWGGPSFYTGGHRSSMQRPLPAGFLHKDNPLRHRLARFGQLDPAEIAEHFASHSIWSGAAGFANWECLFARWADRRGLRLDYATSLDLADDPELLTPYGLYLSVGHDEYWSASMRDHLENWVEGGGTAVFLSGNTAFWQVRFEGDGSQVVGYKNDFRLDPVMGTDAQHTVSTMWSDPLCRRPETEMTGVSFSYGGYAHMRSAPMGSGGYTVWRPDHWAFDGLHLRAGDIVGAEPVVVGYECDGCRLQLADGRPVATGEGGTPPEFEVLATAPAHLWETEEAPDGLPDSYIGELNWVAERLGGADTAENRQRYAYGHAVMGTHRRGRGQVFTVGCTDWAYGLDDPAIDRITTNVIERGLGRAVATRTDGEQED